MGKLENVGMKEAMEQFKYIDIERASSEELERYINDITPLYNYALSIPDYAYATKLDNAQKDAIKAYTKAQENSCYARILDMQDPLKVACIELTYPTLKIKDVQEEGCTPERTIEPADKKIDILKLHLRSNRTLGVDPNWDFQSQKYNQILTARAAKLIISGKDDLKETLEEICNSMTMHRLAKEIESGVKDPTSNTQLLKALNALVSAMIGEEYKCTSHDVQYMLMLYHKKGKKALSVQCSKHSAFAGILAEICHAKLMNKDYSVEFQVKKK